MKSTVLLAGVPPAERSKASSRLQRLGACVLCADDLDGAREHLVGGAVDALVLDIALRAHADGALGDLLREARRRGVLVVGVGVWPVVDGIRLAAQLDKPLDAALLARLLSAYLG